MANKFFAEFNKTTGYCAWESNEKFDCIGSMDEFNNHIYKKISSEIIDTLGLKATYTIFEVAYYFKSKYLAYRIPYQYFRCYKDSSIDNLSAYKNINDMEAMDSSFTLDENNITLVIDTVFNSGLRKRYPDIVKVDELNNLRLKQEKHYVCRHENPIFILGTNDGKCLNSVYLLSGDCVIEDLNHEFYFFYKHS